MTTVRRSTLRAARTLALDAATAQVVTAFQELDLPCMLLKGPAMAARLYAEDVSQRSYTDIDLLVPPRFFAAASEVLESMGYERGMPSSPPGVGPASYEQMWLDPDNPGVVVDLHRGFHGVRRKKRFWELMGAHADTLVVGGVEVPVPDVPACALLVALHMWLDGAAQRPMADLERALSCFDDAVWQEASEIAAQCEALPAFTIGLGKRPDGAVLVRRLGLSTAAAPVVWLRSSPTLDGTFCVGQMLGEPSWRRRLVLAPRLAFPSARYMRGWARQHPFGQPSHAPSLGTAYALRLIKGVQVLPAAAANWRTSTRAAAESGWVPPPQGLWRDRLPAVLHRCTLAANAVPLGLWARFAWQRVHRQLPYAGLEGRLSTGTPPLARPLSESQGDHVVRGVLRRSGASCLEESLVRQAWYARRGTARDIVVGVTSPAHGFKAHAWLRGDAVAPGYVELAHKPLGGGVQPVPQ
jgi:hypothetical protein